MLPFTAEILFSSFEQHYRALWPLPMLAPPIALALLLLTFRPVRYGDRAIAAVLALAWAWVGAGYFILHFAAIDFAAPVYGALFILQALLLAWTGVARGGLAFRFAGDLFGWCGLALALAATIAWPVADGLFGYGWASARVLGLAPGPTAIFTLGLLLLAAGRAPLHLAIIPLLWTVIAGATAWILGIQQDFALPTAGVGAFALIVWMKARRRQAQPQRPRVGTFKASSAARTSARRSGPSLPARGGDSAATTGSCGSGPGRRPRWGRRASRCRPAGRTRWPQSS